jgi:hypothetical protein
MFFSKRLVVMLTILVLAGAAVAQQAQANGHQQPATVKASLDAPLTLSVGATAAVESKSGLTDIRIFDFLSVERSLSLPGAGWTRIEKACGNTDAQPKVCSASCLKKCGSCPTCGHLEIFDCTTCSCQPV